MTDRAQQTIHRIAALQDWLRRENLTGIFVPRTDFWQGEEVMECDERLRWLTGFTGSHGFALVLQDRAALFSSGIYTLQAGIELAGSGVEYCHFTERPWQTWLGVTKDVKLAVDGKLVTATWAKGIRDKLKGGTLVALSQNPIDALWEDRPAPNFTPVEIFPLELAGEDSLSKRHRLGVELAKRQLDGAFITDPTGIAWLLNIRARDYAHTPVALSVAFLRADGSAIWFTDPARATPEVKAHMGERVTVLPPSHFMQNTHEFFRQKVLLDEATGSLSMHDKLTGAGAVVTLGQCITTLPKACKNTAELDGFRAAHRRDGAALASFLAWFDGAVAGGQGTLKESQLMEKLADFRASANEARGPSFGTICGWAASGAIVHYHTTPASDAAVTGNGLLLLDSGGQYVDGTTDITRTLAVGFPTEEQKRNNTRVLQGHIAIARAVFPAGTTGHQLDALARGELWRVGLNFDHGTGHGVGHYLAVHEGPQRISPAPNTVALQAGMVISNEPGYYKTGEYGIRIENLVAVVKSDVGEEGRDFLQLETLTVVPYDRRLIVADMLTSAERDWVDGYHARILREIGPLVDDAARGWLERACAPL